ncbi:hypothetical protein ACFL6E_02990 [Candidatus Neomarinimicrobiota bacterium]
MERTRNILVLVLWITALVTPVMSFDAGGCVTGCCEKMEESCPMDGTGGCAVAQSSMPVQQKPGTMVEISSTKVILTEAIAISAAFAIGIDSHIATNFVTQAVHYVSYTVPLLI